MATLLEHAQLVCGFCRVTAAELASAGYEPLDEHTVIRMHVQEDHNVNIEALEGSTQLGATWTLPDGQIWMIKVQSEEE
jgi:hypothetical protein